MSNNKNYNQEESTNFNLWIQEHWWLLIIALFFYIGGIFIPHLNKDEIQWGLIACEVFAKTGELILIGGIIAFFSSYKMIIKTYRDELNKLLIEPEYLKRRADAYEIWDKLSEVILNTKFPEVGKNLLDIVKQYYLVAKDNIRCYSNYDATIVINWDSPDRKWIRIEDSSEFCICADTTTNVTLNQSNRTSAKQDDGTAVRMELRCGDKHVEETGVYNDTKKMVICEVSMHLSGKTEYDIIKKTNKRLSLGEDDFIGFTANYITNGMSIKVSHPRDMKLTMSERGTIHEFKKVDINDTTCEFKYKGLILPRQGYTIFISAL